jgi:1-acyl-sn-glycerol-3-phosphate acyltransferase
MPYLRAFAFALVMTVSFLFLVPLQTLARQRGWAIQDTIQTGFCRVICAIIGIRVETRGRLSGSPPRYVVANHISWTDVIALASVAPFVFLAKREVSTWPILGLLARLQGTVFVTRGSRRDIPQVNAELCEVMNRGRDLVVFPEGTSSDGTTVLNFRPAHFEALRDYKGTVAIIPTVFLYTDGVKPIDVGWYGDMTFLPHLWSIMKQGGVKCCIFFDEAISTNGENRKTLAAKAEARVRSLHNSQMALLESRNTTS